MVWNKGTKGICKPNKGSFKKGQVPWNKGKKLPKGEKANNWKGDKITINSIHSWLIRTFGRPNKCEIKDCRNTKRIEWALKRGKSYKRVRESFIRLCKKHHIEYDNVLQRGWITRKK